MAWLKVRDFREDEDILDVREEENDTFFSLFFVSPAGQNIKLGMFY